MTGTGRVVGGHLIHRAIAAAPIPICGGAVGLVEVAAGFKSRVRPEVARDQRRDARHGQVVNDHHAGQRSRAARNQEAAHLHRGGRHEQGAVALGKRGIHDAAHPAGTGGAARDEVGFANDAVAGVKEEHGQAHLGGAEVVHFVPLEKQRVAGTGIAAELHVGVPLAVEIASHGINEGQRMIGTGVIIGDHLADRRSVSAATPIQDRAVRLVQVAAEFEGWIHPEVSEQQIRQGRARHGQVVNDHDPGDRSGTAGNEGTTHPHRAEGHRERTVALREGRIRNRGVPSGITGASRDKVGLADHRVSGIEEQHG